MCVGYFKHFKIVSRTEQGTSLPKPNHSSTTLAPNTTLMLFPYNLQQNLLKIINKINK